MIGYLDIETSFEQDMTVFGFLRPDTGLLQLVGDAITKDSIRESLEGIDTLCTFGGEWFDLPVIHRQFGIDLLEDYRSVDLTAGSRRAGRRGGLKRIEAELQIPRKLRGINGYDAMVLWKRWQNGDRQALERLLAYNADDVINLALLERRLRGDLELLPPTKANVVGV